jgi:hypothetical protein
MLCFSSQDLVPLFQLLAWTRHSDALWTWPGWPEIFSFHPGSWFGPCCACSHLQQVISIWDGWLKLGSRYRMLWLLSTCFFQFDIPKKLASPGSRLIEDGMKSGRWSYYMINLKLIFDTSFQSAEISHVMNVQSEPFFSFWNVQTEHYLHTSLMKLQLNKNAS